MTARRPVALAIAASLLTSAAPPPVPVRTAGLHDPASPVRCTLRQPEDYPAAGQMVVTGARIAPKADRSRAMALPPPPPPPMAAPAPRPQQAETARYEGREVGSIRSVADAPVSTFSVDVDTGSYANVRRFLGEGRLPPADAVRTEELINYFRYDYPRPADRTQPFSVTTDVARTPWNPATRLLRIGLRGYDVAAAERPAANLVFLVDVSGSMSGPERLPLVKSALTMLADRLRPNDRVSIVVYAGNAGLVLAPTANREYVKTALACLEAGGSTAGGAGLQLAYATARAAFIPNGINRILIATDGDFNVGVADNRALEDMVRRNRDTGVTLTTLGFGTSNYNEALMERIADLGNGNYAYIDSVLEARKVLDEELESTLFTIAQDVKVQVEFNPAEVGEYRLIGYENRALAEEDFTNDAVDAGDIGAGHQVTALYEVTPRGAAGWLPARRYPGNRPRVARGGGEAAFVRLRYKLPGGTASRLIERAVPATLLATARPPAGDMAFAVAVAAFGQRLRGDKYLGGYGLGDARRLAGDPAGYWRQEFVRLAALAEAQSPQSGS